MGSCKEISPVIHLCKSISPFYIMTVRGKTQFSCFLLFFLVFLSCSLPVFLLTLKTRHTCYSFKGFTQIWEQMSRIFHTLWNDDDHSDFMKNCSKIFSCSSFGKMFVKIWACNKQKSRTVSQTEAVWERLHGKCHPGILKSTIRAFCITFIIEIWFVRYFFLHSKKLENKFNRIFSTIHHLSF